MLKNGNRVRNMSAMALVMGASVFGLTGCAYGGTGETPSYGNQENPASFEDGYSLEFVSLSIGKTARCLYYMKDFDSATMSCYLVETASNGYEVFSSDEKGYSEEYVTVENGETELCLYYMKDFDSATMSCFPVES